MPQHTPQNPNIPAAGREQPTAVAGDAPAHLQYFPSLSSHPQHHPADNTSTAETENVYLHEICAAAAPRRRFPTQQAAIDYANHLFCSKVSVRILSPSEALIVHNGHTLGHIRRWVKSNNRWGHTV